MGELLWVSRFEFNLPNEGLGGVGFRVFWSLCSQIIGVNGVVVQDYRVRRVIQVVRRCGGYRDSGVFVLAALIF